MGKLCCEFRLNERQAIQVCQGDLTLEEVDIIVNAANGYLSHGGGVAGAIVQRGGWKIQEESDAWIRERGTVPTGGVAVTGAGNLPCKKIIHAVGPVWQGGDVEEDLHLKEAVLNSLTTANELGMASIALPAISSGIFGFPKERCARIMIDTAVEFLRSHPTSSLRLVRFTNIDSLTAGIFEQTLRGYLL